MTTTIPQRALHLLLVEDNPGDVDLMLEVLNEAAFSHRVTVAVDGVEALDVLRGPGEVPDLVILDLNLPRKDGRDVLRDMKADSRLRQIPVIILSSSRAASDLSNAYALGANCYVTKPADVDAYFAAVREIQAFWMGLVTLPPPLAR
jgi:two-component system, chemotaxis family, response regulator Rcp1